MRPVPESHTQHRPHQEHGGAASIFQWSADIGYWSERVVGWREKTGFEMFIHLFAIPYFNSFWVWDGVCYHGCNGATCRDIMSLHPAPRAQITSWPTGSVALLKQNKYAQITKLHAILYRLEHDFGIKSRIVSICFYRAVWVYVISQKTGPGCQCESLPVCYSLKGSAVAAGQPKGAISQQVGAVWNLQYQQVTSCGL